MSTTKEPSTRRRAIRALRQEVARLNQANASIARTLAKVEEQRQSAEHRSNALMSVNVRREPIDLGNRRTVSVGINAQLYRQSPEAFRRLIMEEVPRQIIAHLQSNPP